MPEERLHIKLDVTHTTAGTIRRLAKERNTTTTGLVLQALGVLHIVHDATKDGYLVGLTQHRENLETVLVLP